MDPQIERSDPKVAWPTGLCGKDLSRHRNRLSDREMKAVSLRFGVDGGPTLTYAEVAKHLDVGQGRVRQIVLDAFRELYRAKHGGGFPYLGDPQLEAARKIALTRFGLELRQIRKRRGCTQAHLSARTAIPVNRLREIESGRTDLDLVTLVKLATALETTPDEMLGNFSWRLPGDDDFGAFRIEGDVVWP